MIVLALILLFPVAVLAAVVAISILDRFRLLPDGVSEPIMFGLFATVCLGLLLLVPTVDDLMVRPARIQSGLVGHQLVSPMRLRGYQTFGFQDPYYEWRYALSAEQPRALRGRCRYDQRAPRPAPCVVARKDETDWIEIIQVEGASMSIIAFGT